VTVPGHQPGRDPRPVDRWVDGLLGVGWVVLVAIALLALVVGIAIALALLTGVEA
jgi:hypothetical protein